MFFAVYVIVVIVTAVECQDRLWTRMAGTSSSDEGKGVALDSSGAVYVAGFVTGDVNGETQLGSRDILLLKYASDGMLEWTRIAGTVDWDEGYAVAVDRISGAIYVTGQAGSNLFGQTNAGGSDIVLMKFASDGTILWTRLAGSSGWDAGYSVAVDSTSGAVYVTGYVSGSLDGQTFIGSFADIVLLKYDSDGIKQWTRLVGSTSDDYGNAVAVDPTSGAVYVTGGTYGSVQGQTNYGKQDTFLLKYAGDGSLIWAQQMGGIEVDEGHAIAIDSASHAVYVAGYSYSALYDESNQGDGDAFIMKFSEAGGLLWTRMVGTSGFDTAYGVVVGASSNVYVTGFAGGSVDGQPTVSSRDLLLMMYASNGTRVWTRMDGTSGFDASHGIALASTGELYIAGAVEGSMHGEPYQYGSDVFLSRYSTNESVPVDPPDTVCQYRTFKEVASQTIFSRYRCIKVNN